MCLELFYLQPDQIFHIFCGLKNSSFEAWGSQKTTIEALESQAQCKNNCFLVKAQFRLFFRQTRLHQNVKHLVGKGRQGLGLHWEQDEVRLQFL